MIAKYGKSLVALAIAALTTLASALTDGHVTTVEGIQVAVAVATAAGVWLVPINNWPWMKTAVAALLAVLTLAVTLIADGHLSGADAVNLALAALGVLGVHVAPARSEPAQ